MVLRLALSDDKPTFQSLSIDLGMSASEVHGSVERAVQSNLVSKETRRVVRAHLLEFLLHGVRYVFPPVFSTLTRGVPTAHAVAPLARHFGKEELPPVWPHPNGTVRGQGLEPLYRSAPQAALNNTALHEWLALVDALRSGRAREREIAAREVKKRLEN